MAMVNQLSCKPISIAHSLGDYHQDNTHIDDDTDDDIDDADNDDDDDEGGGKESNIIQKNGLSGQVDGWMFRRMDG